MRVPFINLNSQHRQLAQQINSAIKRVIQKGDFILGEEVKLFEKEFAQFCLSRYAVGVSSGTEAIFLGLASLGIKEGDEVIVPDFTYIATSLAVSYTGARPVFVDIEEATYNISPQKIKEAITKRTKAIIPVHLYGQPANMPEILKIAKAYKLRVIEDAAQAHGAAIKMQNNTWKMAGGIGDIGCFSFYPTKNLSCMGDGGLLVTNDQNIYKKLLSLRDYGRVSKYEHEAIGYNARLDTLQAAILRVKLKRLQHWNRMRQRLAGLYNNLLKDIEGLVIPYVSPSVKHVYHVYVIRTKMRDIVLKRLKANGIEAIIHYPIPLHLQKAYKNLGYKNGDFPVAEKVAQEIISLPMHPYLKKEQIEFVAKVLTKAME